MRYARCPECTGGEYIEDGADLPLCKYCRTEFGDLVLTEDFCQECNSNAERHKDYCSTWMPE